MRYRVCVCMRVAQARFYTKLPHIIHSRTLDTMVCAAVSDPLVICSICGGIEGTPLLSDPARSVRFCLAEVFKIHPTCNSCMAHQSFEARIRNAVFHYLYLGEDAFMLYSKDM